MHRGVVRQSLQQRPVEVPRLDIFAIVRERVGPGKYKRRAVFTLPGQGRLFKILVLVMTEATPATIFEMVCGSLVIL